MRLLLDTHKLIWWATVPERLTNNVLGFLSDPANELFLSLASIWEMQIKIQNGKLNLGKSLSELISNQQVHNGLNILLVEPSHIYKLQALPDVHRDPFDRIMIAQAIVEDLSLVSADLMFERYPVRLLW